MFYKTKLTIILRSFAFLVDFVLPTAIVSILYELLFIQLLSFEYPQNISTIFGTMLFVSLIIKDIPGNSLGKRIFGLKIVSRCSTNTKIHQRILRNIFIMLIPIECFLAIFDKHQLRIGDRIAKTKIIRKNERWDELCL